MKDLEEKAFNDSKSTDSRTMELIALAQNGDSSAKEKLLLENCFEIRRALEAA